MKVRKSYFCKLLALICAISFVLPLSSCDFGNKKIAILLNDGSITFYSLISSSVTAIVNSKRDEAKVFDAKNNVELQIKQAQEAISSGYTDIICIPVDVNYTKVITELAHKNNIPLVYVNRFPFEKDDGSDMPDNVYYVGMKNYEAGQFQANEYIKDIPDSKEKKIVILRGDYSEGPTKEWLRGMKEVLESDPNTSIVIEQNAQLDRVYSEIFIDALVHAASVDPSLRFDTILAYNDAMALGALDAITKNNLNDQVYISGINGGAESRKAVRKGLLPVSFFQDPSRQGNKAAQILYALHDGKRPDKINWIPLAKVKRLSTAKQNFASPQQSRANELDDWAQEEIEKEKQKESQQIVKEDDEENPTPADDSNSDNENEHDANSSNSEDEKEDSDSAEDTDDN